MAKKIVKIINSCSECTELKSGRTFGNDGRDGRVTYKCKRGMWGGQEVLFGGKEDSYYMRFHEIPKEIPKECTLEEA